MSFETDALSRTDRQARLAGRLPVYAVTQRYGSDEQLLDELGQALAAGVRMVQLREKAYRGHALQSLASQVKALTDRFEALLIINDDAVLAKQVGAAGVHLGQTDGDLAAARQLLGPEAIIGATAHNVAEAVAAERAGADYLGVGDVFGTASKPDTIPLPLPTLRAIVSSVSVPVVAIGGISAENASRLAGTGLDGLAVISSIFGQADVPAQVRKLHAAAARLKGQAASIATALTIAGSDSSGGAGIQADLKTMTVHGVYGMSAITALTAQNTTGVQGIFDVSPEFVAQQLDSIFTDIRPDAVKIGMVANARIIERIAAKLRQYKAGHIVVDPVMIATSGSNLMAGSAVSTLVAELFPLAELVTPNRFEAETLCGFAIESEADMARAAAAILKFGCQAVLIKGGHIGESASDYLLTRAEAGDAAGADDATGAGDAADGGLWLRGPRIENPNTHGTGCTLSSAIACNLAKGMDLADAVRCAKGYLTTAIAAGLDIGAGRGPLLHMVNP